MIKYIEKLTEEMIEELEERLSSIELEINSLNKTDSALVDLLYERMYIREVLETNNLTSGYIVQE